MSNAYTKAMFVSEDTIALNEINDEVNRLSAERDAELEPVNRKIETIEEIQSQIQQTGMSRPLAARIRDITGNDRVWEDEGASLESFTSFSSNHGVKFALEVTEDQKNILLGVGIAAGLGLIIKIVMMIWNYFKKRKETTQSRKEKEKEVADKAKGYQEALKELSQHQDFKKELDKIKKSQEWTTSEEKWKLSYTRLIDEIIKGQGEIQQTAEKVFKNIPAFEKAAVDALAVTEEINSNLDDWFREGGPGGSIMKRKVEEVYQKFAPQDMRNNLEAIRETMDKLDDYKVAAHLDDAQVEKIIESLAQDRTLYFWSKIENYNPLDKHGLGNSNYDERCNRSLQSLKNHLSRVESQQLKIDEESTKILKEFTEYYEKTMKLFLNCVLFYSTLSTHWKNFLDATNRKFESRKKLMINVAKIFGKDAVAKAGFGENMRKFLNMLDDK